MRADDRTPHAGSAATLTAAASHDLADVAYVYQWYKDGKLIENADSYQISVTASGKYTVRVAANDGEQISPAAEAAPVTVTVEGHIFGEWTQIKAPSGTDKGSMQRKCTVCGYTEIQSIGLNGQGQVTPAETGDDNDSLLWLHVLMASGMLLAGSLLFLKKKKA